MIPCLGFLIESKLLCESAILMFLNVQDQQSFPLKLIYVKELFPGKGH